MLKKVLAALLAALMAACPIGLCACGQDKGYNVIDDPTEEQITKTNTVVITVKDFGSIYVELYPSKAPITVRNFKDLVAKKYYDGTTFHRIVESFVIQGGRGEQTDSIKGEFSSNGVDNPIKHERGVISMARVSNNFDSATSQFFICLTTERCARLDGDYAAFGKVVKGMEVVDAIAAVKVNNETPLESIVIESVRFCKSSEVQ